MRDAIAKWHPLRHTEFATIRLRLLKIAARISERAAFVSARLMLDAETFSLVTLDGGRPSTVRSRTISRIRRDPARRHCRDAGGIRQ